MELAKIESLLDNYFEGNTTLAEEALLQEYFTGDEVAPHLMAYQALFAGFQQARNEVSVKEIKVPGSSVKTNNWWYGIAAMLVVGLTVGGFLFSQPQLSQEEQEAMAAYENAKETMFMLSENLNKGTEGIAYLTEFNKGTSSISHINQFTNTKNKILK